MIRIGRQRVRRGGLRTAHAAEQARQDLVSQAPERASDGGLTVAVWLDKWVASLPKRVRLSTAIAYTAHVVNVLRPGPGPSTARRAARAQVQAMFDELVEHTNRYDVKITASTVQGVRATLRRALNAAAATLTVAQTLVELPGAVAESEPKTATGDRSITLDSATVEVLANHRRLILTA